MAKISVQQVTNWFVNARARKWKPMYSNAEKAVMEEGAFAPSGTDAAPAASFGVNPADVPVSQDSASVLDSLIQSAAEPPRQQADNAVQAQAGTVARVEVPAPVESALDLLYRLEDSDAELEDFRGPPVEFRKPARKLARVISIPIPEPARPLEDAAMDYDDALSDDSSGAPLDAVLLLASKKRKRKGNFVTPTMILNEIRQTGQELRKAPLAKKVRCWCRMQGLTEKSKPV